ncbi:MAG: signal peptidase II [Nitrospirae bacterium]|nr:MAG: signal peptidase II [Nitrospirota bacterium]
MEGHSLSLRKTTYLLISLLIIIGDQVTKLLVTEHIRYYESIRVLPFFQIVNVKNTGAAFGLFRGLGNPFFIALSVAAICFILYLILRDDSDLLSLSFILGGAAGNLIDRIRLGYVVDFLDFYLGKHHWPAFNIADAALTVGISLLFIRMVFEQRRRPETSNPQ